jgi:putative FmdB family regulatory protein
MPIYAYKCAECGHELDVIRKVSDPRLTECPNCGKPALVKQITAAGFHLKGAGWYVTDFRDGGSGKKKDSDRADEKAKTDQAADSKTEAKADTKTDTKANVAADSKGAAKTEAKTESKSEPASKPTPPAPSPPKTGSSETS